MSKSGSAIDILHGLHGFSGPDILTEALRISIQTNYSGHLRADLGEYVLAQAHPEKGLVPAHLPLLVRFYLSTIRFPHPISQHPPEFLDDKALQSALLDRMASLLGIQKDFSALPLRKSAAQRLRQLLVLAHSKTLADPLREPLQVSLALLETPENDSKTASPPIPSYDPSVDHDLANWETVTANILRATSHKATLCTLKDMALFHGFEATTLLLRSGDLEILERTLKEFRSGDRPLNNIARGLLIQSENPDVIYLLRSTLDRNEGAGINLEKNGGGAISTWSTQIILRILGKNPVFRKDLRAWAARIPGDNALKRADVRLWFHENEDALRDGHYAAIPPPSIQIEYPPWSGIESGKKAWASIQPIFDNLEKSERTKQIAILVKLPRGEAIDYALKTASKYLGKSNSIPWSTVHALHRMDLPDFLIQREFWLPNKGMVVSVPQLTDQENARLWLYHEAWFYLLRIAPQETFKVMAVDAARSGVKTSDLLRLAASLGYQAEFTESHPEYFPMQGRPLKTDWELLYHSKNPCYRIIAFEHYDKVNLSPEELLDLYREGLFHSCSYVEERIIGGIRTSQDFRPEVVALLKQYIASEPFRDGGTSIFPEDPFSAYEQYANTDLQEHLSKEAEAIMEKIERDAKSSANH